MTKIKVAYRKFFGHCEAVSIGLPFGPVIVAASSKELVTVQTIGQRGWPDVSLDVLLDLNSELQVITDCTEANLQD